ncbi:MAG: lysozyme [Betaproteobacteria bacterium]
MELATRKRAAWLAIAIASVGSFEGLRRVAYLDPVGIPTICFGETSGVKLGQVKTVEQCKDMLEDRLLLADRHVRSCTKVPLPDYRRAALVSFAYNVGGSAYCNSSLVRKLNAGDTVGACQELNRWVYAKGIKLPGLVARRGEEYQMCMRELA